MAPDSKHEFNDELTYRTQQLISTIWTLYDWPH